jgi:hypothetical protein
MATVIDQLACSLGRRDEVPNQELAQKIVKAKDKSAVKELVQHLQHKDKAIRNDCIKVLYETAGAEPKLVAPYISSFIELLDHKDNRMQWGAMTALSAVTKENPSPVYDAIDTIIDVADKGSVITNDHCVNILVHLCGEKKYTPAVFPFLMERLKKSPENQLPMYAEKTLPVINAGNKTAFIQLLQSRMKKIEKESKKKRLEKVLKQAEKK